MDTSWQSLVCITIFIIWIPSYITIIILYYRKFNHIVLKWRLPVITIVFAFLTLYLDLVLLSNEIIIRQLGYYPCLFQTIATAAFPAIVALGAFKGSLLALNYNAQYRKKSRLAIFLRPNIRNYTLIFLLFITFLGSTIFFIISNDARNIYSGRECHFEHGETLWITIAAYSLAFPYFLATGIHIIRVRDRWSIGPESIIGILPMALTAALYMILTCYYRFTDQLQLRYDIEDKGLGFAIIFTATSIAGQILIIGRPLYIIYFRYKKKNQTYNSTNLNTVKNNTTSPKAITTTIKTKGNTTNLVKVKPAPINTNESIQVQKFNGNNINSN